MDLQFGNTNVLRATCVCWSGGGNMAQGRARATGMALAAGVALKATPALAYFGDWTRGPSPVGDKACSLLSLGYRCDERCSARIACARRRVGFVREGVPHPDDLSLGRCRQSVPARGSRTAW